MPGYWMNEGGQSSTGQVGGKEADDLLVYSRFHIVDPFCHHDTSGICWAAQDSGGGKLDHTRRSVLHSVFCIRQPAELQVVLNEKLDELVKLEGVSSRTELTKDLHMYPDLHGGGFVVAPCDKAKLRD